MKRIGYLMVGILVIVSPVVVFAHRGGTDANGCHTCKTNCSKYGLYNGQYHCHNNKQGTSNKTTSNKKVNNKTASNRKVNNRTVSNTLSSSNKTASSNVKTVTQVAKSQNVNIKGIYINGDTIKMGNELYYETGATSIKMAVTLEDSQAKAEYKSEVQLADGDNELVIKVTAQDISVTKTYILHVKKLSNDTRISVKVDGQEINLDDEMEYVTDKENIDLKYEPLDKRTTINVNGDTTSLTEGQNIIILEVIAEDGTKKSYKLIINKESKAESQEPTNNDELRSSSNIKSDKADDSDDTTGGVVFVVGSIISSVGLAFFTNRKK